ncbi:MAG: DEAD/DEAH box helicase family protein [Streptococcaceae bacterium]|jgi:superfamily II DNA or RNA helicase|nr:DEAD/DEAH box helicase family protein [Streptococcaceae bacterium]
MLKIGSEYTLKDNKKAKIVRLVKNYFNAERFFEVEIQDELFVVKLQEFEANLKIEDISTLRTLEDKIKLYRSYFRGRDDIVADSFQNQQTGKMVYYPYCLTRKRGNCPKIKNERFQCSKCQVSQFRLMSDELILEHFKGVRPYKSGEVLYGLYPILKDNTCYLLAIDFDKGNWKEEIKAVARTSIKFGLTPLIELSQSGNGAYIWYFFETNISARKARKLGHAILKQTMIEFPELSFESFDRLFPNQDELSEGGFGNLIALPLQGYRVKKGTSRFLDIELNLEQDVLGTLEKIPKLSMRDVDRILSTIDIEFNFFRPQNEKDSYDEISIFDFGNSDANHSKELTIKINGALSFERQELSGEEQARLKTLATFHNSEFYKKMKKRLSTKDTPRLISLAEFDRINLRLPRGLLPEIRKKFPTAMFEDERVKGKAIDLKFIGALYPTQQIALNALSKHDMGILMAGTGFGKTVLAAKLISEKKLSTLILVNNKNLANQWLAALNKFLKIDSVPFDEYTKTGRKKKKNKIGKIFGGQESRSGIIDIALFQTLAKRGDISKLLDEYGVVIVDEVHHVAAFTFEKVIKQVKSHYIYGLTATPKREDGLENIEYLRIGPIRYQAEREIPKHIEQKLFLRFTSLGEHNNLIEKNRIHDNYGLMIHSQDRNEQIVADIKQAVSEKRHLIVLTRQIEHIDQLLKLIAQYQIDVPIYVLNSAKKAKESKEELAELRKEERSFILLTTGSYAGEGFDLPKLDTLVLAMPYSGKTSMQQFLGRLLRNLEEKEELRVYDYVDYAIPMIYRMYQKRMSSYKRLGYEMFTDEKSTLYKSDFYEHGYETQLFNDLKESKKTINLIIPFLSNSLTSKLESIKNSSIEEKVIILPNLQTIASNYQDYIQMNINRLLAIGFQVKYTGKFKQKFVIIDGRLIWILPENNQDKQSEIAARMYSKKMAESLARHFS